MAFHIDGSSTCLQAQRGLASPGGDHLLDPRETAPDHAAASQRDAGNQLVAQRQAGQPARVSGQDLGRHHHIA